MLYPQNNSKRLALKLDGIWAFRKDPADQGRQANWASHPPTDTIPMPVPAAFNEMVPDASLRDYVGVVWYFLNISSPPGSEAFHQILRFGAVVHRCEIFLNGEKVGQEGLGKLPFEVEVTGRLTSEVNRLAIRVDTTLTWQSFPPGTTKQLTSSWSVPNLHGSDAPRPEYHFDHLNGGGLLRSVWLLVLPPCHLTGVSLQTVADGDRAVGWKVLAKVNRDASIRYRLLDPKGREVAEVEAATAAKALEIHPPEPQAWSPATPCLYTLEIVVGEADLYRLPLGLRTVRVTPNALLLNGEPTYLSGFGMHEDLHLIGQGHSDARAVKDLTMLKAMGANSFRTTHYPYDETVYQLADQLGILVISETPANGMNAWDSYPVFTEERCNAATLAQHKRIVTLMIERDHIHPCVIMWSLANEVSCHEPAAASYFQELFAHCRAIDPQHLPVTVVQSSTPPGYPSHNSQTAPLCDVICWNRYYGWYQDSGHLEDIEPQLRNEAAAWRAGYPNKPLIMSEFGADAVPGLHHDPPTMFSEEYQREVIHRYCETLDTIPYVIGEHVWNFADFATKQGLTRVDGNRKGVHTRERQPKLAAHYLKQRWLHKISAPTS